MGLGLSPCPASSVAAGVGAPALTLTLPRGAHTPEAAKTSKLVTTDHDNSDGSRAFLCVHRRHTGPRGSLTAASRPCSCHSRLTDRDAGATRPSLGLASRPPSPCPPPGSRGHTHTRASTLTHIPGHTPVGLNPGLTASRQAAWSSLAHASLRPASPTRAVSGVHFS